jgi:hypothetical protein
MSLIKREPSPAQSEASRANSLHSTGPRSEQGKAVASRNSLKPRPFSEVVARSMEALGERPADFEQMHQALAAAILTFSTERNPGRWAPCCAAGSGA